MSPIIPKNSNENSKEKKIILENDVIMEQNGAQKGGDVANFGQNCYNDEEV